MNEWIDVFVFDGPSVRPSRLWSRLAGGLDADFRACLRGQRRRRREAQSFPPPPDSPLAVLRTALCNLLDEKNPVVAACLVSPYLLLVPHHQQRRQPLEVFPLPPCLFLFRRWFFGDWCSFRTRTSGHSLFCLCLVSSCSSISTFSSYLRHCWNRFDGRFLVDGSCVVRRVRRCRSWQQQWRCHQQ